MTNHNLIDVCILLVKELKSYLPTTSPTLRFETVAVKYIFIAQIR